MKAAYQRPLRAPITSGSAAISLGFGLRADVAQLVEHLHGKEVPPGGVLPANHQVGTCSLRVVPAAIPRFLRLLDRRPPERLIEVVVETLSMCACAVRPRRC